MIFSMYLIKLNFLNNCIRILTTRKVIDVIDMIDKNRTIVKSIPKLISIVKNKINDIT